MNLSFRLMIDKSSRVKDFILDESAEPAKLNKTSLKYLDKMATFCKEKGLTVIALTNLRHTNAGASRHQSGKRLCEIADIVLDNCGCVGDACIEIDGIEGKICATSTVAGAMILNAAVARAVEICAENNFYPEHFCSANIDGGDDINNRLIEKYKKEIKHL